MGRSRGSWWPGHRRASIATCAGAVVAAVVVVVLALPRSSAATLPAGAAEMVACAKSDAALPATAPVVPRGFVLQDRVGETSLPSMGVGAGRTQVPSANPFLWLQTAQFADREGAGGFDAMSQATPGTGVVVVVETIEVLSSVSAAQGFVSEFGPPATPAEVTYGGGLHPVRTQVVSLPALRSLGDQVLALTVGSGLPGFASEAQYVIRTGSVVRTYALYGGAGITATAEAGLAAQFVHASESACGVH